VSLHLADQAPDGPPLAIELHTGDEPMTIETVAGTVRTRPGRAEEPDLTLTGAPLLVLGVLTGRLDLAAARARGLKCEGDPAALRRLRAPLARPREQALRTTG
jgi:hypothetical protein